MTTIPPSDARGATFDMPPPGIDGQLTVAGWLVTARTSARRAGPASSWHELTTVVGDRVVAGVGQVHAPREGSEADPSGIREQIWGRMLAGEDVADAISAEAQRNEGDGGRHLDAAYLSAEPDSREVRLVARGDGISALLVSPGRAAPVAVPQGRGEGATSVEVPEGTTLVLTAHDPSWKSGITATISQIREVELAGLGPESAAILLCARLAEVLHPYASVVAVHATPLEGFPAAAPTDLGAPRSRLPGTGLAPLATRMARPHDGPRHLLPGPPDSHRRRRRERPLASAW